MEPQEAADDWRYRDLPQVPSLNFVWNAPGESAGDGSDDVDVSLGVLNHAPGVTHPVWRSGYGRSGGEQDYRRSRRRRNVHD